MPDRPTDRRSSPSHGEDKIGYLRMVDIFRDLSEAEVHEIDRATTITSAHRGKILYMPEETGEVLFMLKEGRVQLYRISPEGKKLVIATIGPGTVFGEMAFIGQGMHNSFAEALEECVLLIMSRTDVEHLLVTKPQVALRIVEVLGRRLQEAETRLAEIAFKSIPARLASLLLQLAEEQGRQAATIGAANRMRHEEHAAQGRQEHAAQGRVTIAGLTHQNLGEQIGTYRETTTQTLNLFKSAGLIDIGRKRITILDSDGLRRIADQT